MEKRLLSAALFDRSAWAKIAQYDSTKAIGESFSEPGNLVLAEISKFYERDPGALRADKAIIKKRIERKYPKHADLLTDIVEALRPGSVPNVLEEYRQLRLAALGQEISVRISNKPGDPAVRELVEEYLRLDSGPFVEDATTDLSDVDDLVSIFDPANLIKLSPNALNDSIEGGAVPGDHILVYGPPEVGKSLISINMAAAVAHRGHSVLYVGNEDSTAKMKMRFLSRFTSWDRGKILLNAHRARDKAIKHGMDNLHYAPMSPGTFPQIEGLIRQYDPKIVILDQLRQLSIPGVNGELDQLTRAAKEARRVAKHYNVVVVSVTQANADSCKNKLVLEMDDVYFSNTTVPGDVDIMIGIGMNENFEAKGMRMLSFPKNKSGGGHGHVPIEVYPKISLARSK